MVATLGSGESGGSIHIMDLSDTIDVAMGSMNAYGGNIIPVASFNRTIWTADCNSDGTQAVIGEFWVGPIIYGAPKMHLLLGVTI